MRIFRNPKDERSIQEIAAKAQVATIKDIYANGTGFDVEQSTPTDLPEETEAQETFTEEKTEPSNSKSRKKKNAN